MILKSRKKKKSTCVFNRNAVDESTEGIDSY